MVAETSRAGLLEISQDQISFRLPVLREITYQSLTPAKRSQLHFWVGRWLEEQNPAINDIEALTIILNHYLFANKTTSFLRIIERILGFEFDIAEFPLDCNILESALSIEEFPLSSKNRFRCFEMLGEAYFREKRFEESTEIYQRLIDDEEWKEIAHYGILHLKLGSSLGTMGHFRDASFHFERAFQELLPANVDAAGRALGGLNWVLYQAGDVDKSREYTFKYYDLVEKIAPVQAQYPHLLGCAKLFALHNLPDQAQNCYQRICKDSVSPWQSHVVIQAYRVMIQLHIKQGMWTESIRTIDFLDKNRPVDGIRENNWFNSYLRAMTLIASGQVERGLDLFEKIEVNMKAFARPTDQLRIQLDLIQIDYHSGNYFQGMHRIRTSMGIARRLGVTHMEVIVRTWAVLYRDMI